MRLCLTAALLTLAFLLPLPHADAFGRILL